MKRVPSAAFSTPFSTDSSAPVSSGRKPSKPRAGAGSRVQAVRSGSSRRHRNDAHPLRAVPSSAAMMRVRLSPGFLGHVVLRGSGRCGRRRDPKRFSDDKGVDIERRGEREEGERGDREREEEKRREARGEGEEGERRGEWGKRREGRGER